MGQRCRAFHVSKQSSRARGGGRLWNRVEPTAPDSCQLLRTAEHKSQLNTNRCTLSRCRPGCMAGCPIRGAPETRCLVPEGKRRSRTGEVGPCLRFTVVPGYWDP